MSSQIAVPVSDPEQAREALRAALAEGALRGARALLGWYLVRGPVRARLVEVEAYGGPDDPGSHAYRRRTPRNGSMFDRPGVAYVYFTYGMHWLLNVSARPLGEPSAILLRAALPVEGLEVMRQRRPGARHDRELLAGPARLAQAFAVTKGDDGRDLLEPTSDLRLEPGPPACRIVSTRRVGLRPGAGDALEWRFVDLDALEWVSRPRPGS